MKLPLGVFLLLLSPLLMMGQEEFSDTTRNKVIYGAGLGVSDNIGAVGMVYLHNIGGIVLKAGLMWNGETRPYYNYVGRWLITNYRVSYQSPLVSGIFYAGLGYAVMEVRDKGSYYINSVYWESYERKVQKHTVFQSPELEFGAQATKEASIIRFGIRFNYILNPEDVQEGLPVRNEHRRRIFGLGRIDYENPDNFAWGLYMDIMIRF